MGKTPKQQSFYDYLQTSKTVQIFHEGSVEKYILYNRKHLGIYGEDWAREVMKLLGITAEDLAVASN